MHGKHHLYLFNSFGFLHLPHLLYKVFLHSLQTLFLVFLCSILQISQNLLVVLSLNLLLQHLPIFNNISCDFEYIKQLQMI